MNFRRQKSTNGWDWTSCTLHSYNEHRWLSFPRRSMAHHTSESTTESWIQWPLRAHTRYHIWRRVCRLVRRSLQVPEFPLQLRILINRDCRPLEVQTTFLSPNRLYRLLPMLFILRNAPSTISRAMLTMPAKVKWQFAPHVLRRQRYLL